MRAVGTLANANAQGAWVDAAGTRVVCDDQPRDQTLGISYPLRGVRANKPCA